MYKILLVSIPLIFWAVLIVSFIHDRSRYRNCFFLFFALASTFLSLALAVMGIYPKLVVIVFMLFILMLMIVPLFLSMNGLVMIKREGISLANLLSLAFGIAIGIGELAFVSAVFVVRTDYSKWVSAGFINRLSSFNVFLSVSVIYVSMSFLVFMIYCIFLQIIPRKRDFDYVIIHGAGLLDGGRVSKLLSDRLDKAIEIYSKDPTPPVMIPSGGRGSDETVSEAEAMAGYLIEKGIPEDMIIMEDKSATTYENLLNSKKIIEGREGRKYTVLVTSNYHVYRALRHCRKVGLECTGVGSHVAFYYWPSALIREYIAVHAEKKHLILLIIGWILSILPIIVLING